MSSVILNMHRRSVDVSRRASLDTELRASSLTCVASRAPSMLTVMELGDLLLEPQQLSQQGSPVHQAAPGTPQPVHHHHAQHQLGHIQHKKPSGSPIVRIGVLLVALVCFLGLMANEGFVFGVGHRKLVAKQQPGAPARMCAVGSYLDGSSCKKCGPRLTTLAPGAVGFDMCVAPPGFYVSGNRARPCPKGTYSSSHSNAPACTPCRKGRTTPTEGAKQGTACRRIVNAPGPEVTSEDVGGIDGKPTVTPGPATGGTEAGPASPIPSPSPLPDNTFGTVQISPLPNIHVLPPVDPRLEVHPSPEPASSSSSPEPAAGEGATTPVRVHDSAVVEGSSPLPDAAVAASPEPTADGSGGPAADGDGDGNDDDGNETPDGTDTLPQTGAAQDVVPGEGQVDSPAPTAAPASPKPKNFLDIPVYAQPIEDLNNLP